MVSLEYWTVKWVHSLTLTHPLECIHCANRREQYSKQIYQADRHMSPISQRGHPNSVSPGARKRAGEWARKGRGRRHGRGRGRGGATLLGRASLAVGQFFAREINEMLNKQNVTLFTKWWGQQWAREREREGEGERERGRQRCDFPARIWQLNTLLPTLFVWPL